MSEVGVEVADARVGSAAVDDDRSGLAGPGLEVWLAALRALDHAGADTGRLAPHPSFWKWVAFDPPMRDAETLACVPRRVLCTVCDRQLGVTDDPVEALFIARRHRRQVRRGR